MFFIFQLKHFFLCLSLVISSAADYIKAAFVFGKTASYTCRMKQDSVSHLMERRYRIQN